MSGFSLFFSLNFLTCTKHSYNSKLSGSPQQHSKWAAHNWAGVEEANHSRNKTTNTIAASHPQVCHFFPTFPARAEPHNQVYSGPSLSKDNQGSEYTFSDLPGHCCTPQNFSHSHAFLSPHKSIPSSQKCGFLLWPTSGHWGRGLGLGFLLK